MIFEIFTKILLTNYTHLIVFSSSRSSTEGKLVKLRVWCEYRRFNHWHYKVLHYISTNYRYCKSFLQDRPYSYENMNLDGINAMLNVNDVSMYLKISPQGLEVGDC